MPLRMTKDPEGEKRDKDIHQTLFKSFMEAPATRLMMSMIPPSENPDVLNTLLESAFRAGEECGGCSVMADIASKIFDRHNKE